MISDNDGKRHGHDILSAGFGPFATLASRPQIAEPAPGGSRSNCRKLATRPAKISGVTFAPHEKPN
jgi:hypothetical protein